MPALLKNPGPQSFVGELIPHEPGGGAYFEFPYDVGKLYGSAARIPVDVEFRRASAPTGTPVTYKGSMCKMGMPCHIIIMLKAIREELGVKPGDKVHVTVHLDASERVVELPDDLAKVLKAHTVDFSTAGAGASSSSARQTAFDLFRAQSYTCQKEYVQWIEEAKKAETHAKRLADTVDKVVQRARDKAGKGKGKGSSKGEASAGAGAPSDSSRTAKATAKQATAVTTAGPPAKTATGKRGRQTPEAEAAASAGKMAKR